ncbi:MAG: lipoyl synthase, partial [Candidatus Thermoplasmatota archaeon]|nr:lipoyl synthase [Candidatus Thermoplasmatota archaeon]
MRPEYVKVNIPSGENYLRIRRDIHNLTLHTVCEEARCPNIAECWDSGTATFMIMGSNCSRGCRFCAVTHGHMQPLDPLEPEKVSEAARSMGLSYVVITSVDRDDLPDQGAEHFARVIMRVKKDVENVEVLIPDFRGRPDLLRKIIEAEPS